MLAERARFPTDQGGRGAEHDMGFLAHLHISEIWYICNVHKIFVCHYRLVPSFDRNVGEHKAEYCFLSEWKVRTKIVVGGAIPVETRTKIVELCCCYYFESSKPGVPELN